jgi:hypothetical protein
MATTVYQTTSPVQWASAACHVEQRDDWRTIRVNGVRYVVLTSGTSGRIYHVRADATACDCRWYVATHKQCAHMLALELVAMADELQDGWSPIPEAERIAAEAWRRELAERPEPVRKSYADLYPDNESAF